VRHRLNGGELVLPAEGHQQCARADGGVEALGQAAAGADIQVGAQIPAGACETVVP
jgi:hypothetical protein